MNIEEREEYIKKLVTGTYKLSTNVKNPKPDRRQKHDWREFIEWEAGMVFIVDEYVGGKINDKTNEKLIIKLWWRGGGNYSSVDLMSCIEEDLVKLDALLPYLERIEENASDIFKRCAVNPGNTALYVLDKLVEQGVVKLETALQLAEEDLE